jgi:hypothetical protein
VLHKISRVHFFIFRVFHPDEMIGGGAVDVNVDVLVDGGTEDKTTKAAIV